MAVLLTLTPRPSLIRSRGSGVVHVWSGARH